jgi:molybdate transport system regulatory protein
VAKQQGLSSGNSEERWIQMKYGARNKVQAKVTSVKKGDVMSLVKFEAVLPVQMASVLTTESVEDLELKVGDEVDLIIKAIHVLPIKK